MYLLYKTCFLCLLFTVTAHTVSTSSTPSILTVGQSRCFVQQHKDGILHYNPDAILSNQKEYKEAIKALTTNNTIRIKSLNNKQWMGFRTRTVTKYGTAKVSAFNIDVKIVIARSSTESFAFPVKR